MYYLEIPPELVSELLNIRDKTGKSIRSQILIAVRTSIKNFKEMERKTYSSFIRADTLIKINGGEKVEANNRKTD